MADEKMPTESEMSEDAKTDEIEGVAEAEAVAVPEVATEEPTGAVAPAADQVVAEAEPPAPPEEPPAADTTAPPASLGAAASADAPVKRKKKRLPRALRPARTRPKRDATAVRKSIVRLEKPEHERGRRQERQGKVVSDAMEKTIVVKVEIAKAHPRYKKVVRRTVKFHAHDERGDAKVGDVVRIVETRPLSKTKHWRLAEIVEAAK